MKINSFKIILLILVTMSLLLISACQSLPFRTSEQTLQTRVTGMMAERVAQDWAGVYEYLNPDYKIKVTKGNFVGMNREILYNDFAVESMVIAPSGIDAVVKTKYDMSVMGFDVADHSETQNWKKIDGKWYYVIKTDPSMGMD